MIYRLIRNLLFLLDPEIAHAAILYPLDLLASVLSREYRQAKVLQAPLQIMGLEFPNPVGLAAGFDKNADHLGAFSLLGFGFIEIGTVTPRAQEGNPKPRLFRLPKANALINRMGFNNKGLDYLIERLQQCQYPGILGINIGKNRTTELTEALNDYLLCFEAVYSYADYITVNISSPNTPGLRNLHDAQALNHLLLPLKEKQRCLADKTQRYVPIVLKISPDLKEEDLKRVAQQCLDLAIDGVIATNTTLDKRAIANYPHGNEEGGLSGAPLFSCSTAVVSTLYSELGQKIPIIAVGGILSADDALKKRQAGAALVQLYTGLIYQGPGLVANIVKAWV